MVDVVKNFRKTFLREAQQLLNSYESDLLQIEKKPADSNLIDSAIRSMHAIKGTSDMYGFEFINELTHKLKSIFQKVRDNELKFNKEIFDMAFSAIGHLRKLLRDETLSDDKLRQVHQNLNNLISKYSRSSSGSSVEAKKSVKENPESLWHIILQTTKEQYFRGISFMNIFKELACLGTFKIERIENSNEAGHELWSITLLTNANAEEINDVFLFIKDNCTLAHLANMAEYGHVEDVSLTESSKKPDLSILETVKTGNLAKKS